MEKTLERQGDRLFYLDFLRAIASIAVIVMHISIEDPNDSALVFETIRYMTVGWCVPVFLMITGTLFLYKDNCSFERVWKHIKKTFLIIVFWGFVYNFISLFLIEGFSMSIITKSAKMIVLADTTYCYQFWYLYALIPMYFLLPIFNEFVKNASKKEFTIVLVMFFVFTIVIPNIVKYTGDFGGALIDKFYQFKSFFFYMLLGAYLKKYSFSKLISNVLLFISFFVLLIAVICGFSNININLEGLYGYDSVYICVLSSAIYLIAKNRVSFTNFSKNVFGSISKYSLGIYIFHVIIIQAFRKIIHFDSTFAPVYISVPVIVLCVLAVSFVASFVAKKIPVIKKLV